MSAELPASSLRTYLDTGTDELKLEDDVATFELGPSTFQWQRHPSRQKYASIELPWPSTSYTLYFVQRVQSGPNDYLSSMDAPSFPSFGPAYSAFFYDERVMTGAGQPPLGQLSFWIVEEDARIARLVVRPASVDLWVDGERASGTRLELNSATDQGSIDIDAPGEYSFPLPRGLGADARIWLKASDGYRDFRSLSGWGGSRSNGVEVEAPDDPIADLSALASQGESTWLEYKGVLPEAKVSKRKVFKTVVAFANGEGGTLLFGVDGDDEVGEIVGLEGDGATLLRQVNDFVRDLITPSAPCTVSLHEVEGKKVIRLDVAPNRGIIYALIAEGNKPEYYVRRNGSTYYARPDELTALIKPAQNGGGPFGWRQID